MIKRVFVVAFLVAVLVRAGFADGVFSFSQYLRDQTIWLWLPMWIGLAIAFITTIGRDEGGGR